MLIIPRDIDARQPQSTILRNMPLRIATPIIHDHTDGELILISKAVLAAHIHNAGISARRGSVAMGWIGAAFVLMLASVAGKVFSDVGPFEGETVRTGFWVGSVIATFLGIHAATDWFARRDAHSTEGVVRNLTTPNPLSLDDLTVTGYTSPDGKERTT